MAEGHGADRGLTAEQIAALIERVHGEAQAAAQFEGGSMPTRREIFDRAAVAIAEAMEKARPPARPWPAPELAKAARVELVDGEWTVERTGVPGVEARESGRLPVRPFVTPPTYVGARYTQTINLGNYESVRFEISISTPCYLAEIDEVQRQVSQWAAERAAAERANIEAWAQTRGPREEAPI